MKKSIGLTVEKDLIDRLDAYAESLPAKPPRSYLIELAIKRLLEAAEKKCKS